MDQLGHLLLGLLLAWPMLSIIRALIHSSRTARLPSGRDALLRGHAPSLPPCDPQAVAEYFASLLSRPKGDTAQPLSLAEFTEMLRDASQDVPRAQVRFDGEGGYRLRL